MTILLIWFNCMNANAQSQHDSFYSNFNQADVEIELEDLRRLKIFPDSFLNHITEFHALFLDSISGIIFITAWTNHRGKKLILAATLSNNKIISLIERRRYLVLQKRHCAGDFYLNKIKGTIAFKYMTTTLNGNKDPFPSVLRTEYFTINKTGKIISIGK